MSKEILSITGEKIGEITLEKSVLEYISVSPTKNILLCHVSFEFTSKLKMQRKKV